MREVDVLIVGGGVSGTALLFCLARYTNLGSVLLLEKEKQLALINSRSTNNSQTIHCGDIETNYNLEKALQVNRRANMLVRYGELLTEAERQKVLFCFPKMVLGVGLEECNFLRERFKQFKPHFPEMELLDAAAIGRWEPAVARGVNDAVRPEEITAIGLAASTSAVDYQALAESFVVQAKAAIAADLEKGLQRQLEVQLNQKVLNISKEGDGYVINTATEIIKARYVVVSAGAHSLLIAQAMGHGLEYSCLPVAGSFYFTPKLLNGKVYTVQNNKLPFAAIHGDPDVLVPGKTRFGPTALLLPLLERYRPETFWEFLKVLRLDGAVLTVLWQLFRISDIRNYILRNLLFEVPWLRRWLFLQDLRKIVPSAQLKDLKFAEGYGGVRPQLIDKLNHKLMLGEARISCDGPIVFNVTPSPGGTDCLGNAEQDLIAIVARLNCEFRAEQLEQELHQLQA
ncbi:MAG: putative malate:quinone oxidoreductase [Cyanobacteriota bacterium]